MAVSDKVSEAREALLDRIIKEAPSTASASMLNLAEAYAYVSQPNVPHGGGSTARS